MSHTHRSLGGAVPAEVRGMIVRSVTRNRGRGAWKLCCAAISTHSRCAGHVTGARRPLLRICGPRARPGASTRPPPERIIVAIEGADQKGQHEAQPDPGDTDVGSRLPVSGRRTEAGNASHTRSFAGPTGRCSARSGSAASTSRPGIRTTGSRLRRGSSGRRSRNCSTRRVTTTTYAFSDYRATPDLPRRLMVASGVAPPAAPSVLGRLSRILARK